MHYFFSSFGLASWSYTETGKRFSYHRLYGQSKLAQVYFSLELANRYENITAYSLHPGAVNTEIARYHQDGFGSIVTWITENSLWIFGKTPAEGTVIQKQKFRSEIQLIWIKFQNSMLLITNCRTADQLKFQTCGFID